MRPSRSALLVLLLALAGCGGAAESAAAAPPPESRPYAPALADVVQALEEGRTDVASERLESLGETPGVEGFLLRARLRLAQGDGVAALAEVEKARRLSATDARVYATAAEIYAALGRSSAGEDEVRLGWDKAGHAPELDRARGVLNLSVPGAAATGLTCLEEARKRAPDLPFLAAPLAAGHRLAGRDALSHGDLPGAATHAAAALALAPDDLDVLELEADVKAAQNDYDGAAALYARLQAAGRDLGEAPALLQQRAGTFELLRKDRAKAIEHYAEARRLGLDDESLGFGATVLEEERRARLDRGIDAYEAGDLDGAKAAFEAALELAPGDLEGQNHLAVVLFRQGRYERAAERWTAVWAGLKEKKLPLVDPVPLNLARAWRMAGQPELALGVVRDFLDQDPQGPWSADARTMLAKLQSELGEAPAADPATKVPPAAPGSTSR